MIRVATFNLENLFTRPAAMNQPTDGAGRKAIEDHATANAIVAKDQYTASDKTKLIALSNKYGWHKMNPPANALVQLQKVRDALPGSRRTIHLRSWRMDAGTGPGGSTCDAMTSRAVEDPRQTEAIVG